MTSKNEIRAVLAEDLDRFLKTGGKVTVCKSVTFKRKNPATGKQKITQGWTEPKNRPSSAWHFIETKRG